MRAILSAALIGAGATLFIDLWSALLWRMFAVKSLDYCLLGRWVLHIPAGRIAHESISTAAPKAHECPVGWATHYAIGVGLALLFIVVAPAGWLDRPTLAPALAFGVVTVILPFLTLQPALGLGVASAKTPSPTKSRAKSLMTHTVFGLGLFVWARALTLLS